ncbi:MAG: hypothetical protein J6575_03420 [Bifidobacterium sp.]|nr:hypothetical protein [Bifidobacterium sp.]
MTRLKRFARRHRPVLQVAGVLLALVLLGLTIGAVVFAVMVASGLAEWAALIWALVSLG